MRWLFERVLGGRLRAHTEQYLRDLTDATGRASRGRAVQVLKDIQSGAGEKAYLGETAWGERLVLPVEGFLKAHGLVTGGTGAGKTSFALLILAALLQLGRLRPSRSQRRSLQRRALSSEAGA